MLKNDGSRCTVVFYFLDALRINELFTGPKSEAPTFYMLVCRAVHNAPDVVEDIRSVMVFFELGRATSSERVFDTASEKIYEERKPSVRSHIPVSTCT